MLPVIGCNLQAYCVTHMNIHAYAHTAHTYTHEHTWMHAYMHTHHKWRAFIFLILI